MSGASGVPISAAQVRDLLSDPKIFPQLADDDTEFVFDSLGLVWFLHLLELRCEVLAQSTDECFSGLTSARRIAAYLSETAVR
ncbi:hypothetical protein [Amycolatopsis alba]|uniref:Carrier domain-containing protein n=1 Tax=Amycolatopsis alba DSM 44262 TaxID=1125972 RepID=A0A229S7L3_AMYAL|nr:hypothetical protein [Amycolatopsis alba]OXM54942.1 hypothetical protein CFP75_02040 [Amycolatopsis alba DSM 44262]